LGRGDPAGGERNSRENSFKTDPVSGSTAANLRTAIFIHFCLLVFDLDLWKLS
jgi:hypothetical protein